GGVVDRLERVGREHLHRRIAVDRLAPGELPDSTAAATPRLAAAAAVARPRPLPSCPLAVRHWLSPAQSFDAIDLRPSARRRLVALRRSPSRIRPPCRKARNGGPAASQPARRKRYIPG